MIIKNKLLLILSLFLSTCVLGQNIPSLSATQLIKKYNEASDVMIINFWSTWCKPCMEEIPHFISISKKLNADLLLVSQDTKKIYESGKLEQLLHKNKWNTADVVWLNETDANYYCPLIDSSWSGVIPASIIINPSKNYYRFFEESLTAEKLEAEIKKAR